MKQYISISLISGCLLINLIIYSVVFASEDTGILTVAFLDVGQGDSIFIEAPNGNQMLIDGGPSGAVVRELSELMPFHDRDIDVVVATHPDKDHVAGLINVFERYEVGLYLDPGITHNTGVYETLLSAVRNEKSEVVFARRGMRIVLDSSNRVYADILFPDRDVQGVESNLGSIVMRLVYGETEVLLTGDAPKSIEQYLIDLDRTNLESDVLKVGHHGSHTSSDEAFIHTVNPEFGIISAGKDNRYGHPHQEVLNVLKKFDIEVFNTAEMGTLLFYSDGVRFWQK